MSKNTSRGTLESFNKVDSICGGFLEHNVLRYCIEYWTIDLLNNPVLVSGMVCIPDVLESKSLKNKLSLLVYCHGTATKYDFIPSQKNDPYGNSYGTFFCGMNGYVTVMPDYIGYGVSKNLDHTYCLAKPLGDQSVDALLASKSLFKRLNYLDSINTSDIFIGGYSEGGIATLALTHLLEQKPYCNEFNIASSCPGASPLVNATKQSLNKPGPNTTTFFILFWRNLCYTTNTNSLLKVIFKPKFIKLIDRNNKDNLYNGKLHYPEITELLPKDPKQVFTDEFLDILFNDKLATDKRFSKILQVYFPMMIWYSQYKYKNNINFIGAGGDYEVLWEPNECHVKENKHLYENFKMHNVGNMFEHVGEGKMLVLNAQVRFYNKARDKINKKSKL